MEIEEYHKCGEPLKWTGLYTQDAKYKVYRSSETNAHPAKMPPALANHILRHLEKLELLHQGSKIVDFMAGTATTGLVAELNGYEFIGVELENHFISMIEQNRNVLKSKIQRDPRWTIKQGDARHLSELIHETAVGLVSPPYANRLADDDRRQFMDKDHLHRRPNTSYTAIISPPYENTIAPSLTENQLQEKIKERIEIEERQVREGRRWSVNSKEVIERHLRAEHSGYSRNPENIGNLKDKLLAGIVSPPYSKAEDGGGIFKEGYIKQDEKYTKNMDTVGKRTYSNSTHNFSDINIGNLKDRALVGITSLPYDHESYKTRGDAKRKDKFAQEISILKNSVNYSDDPNNVGNAKGETYMQAMLTVYKESLKAGISPLVTVTKNPTKNGQLRRLDIDTIKLLELAGYKVVDYHQAVLYEEKQRKPLSEKGYKLNVKTEILYEEHIKRTLDGREIIVVTETPIEVEREYKEIDAPKSQTKGRISFFKRLSKAKGNIVASWEDIIIAIIPGVSK